MLYETPFEKHMNNRPEKDIPQQTSTRHEWASAIKARIANNPRDTSPSPLLTWYHTENEKRRKGQFNEIDIADIRAAMKGVKNSWFGFVEKNKEKVTNIFQTKEIDWKKLMEIKNAT